MIHASLLLLSGTLAFFMGVTAMAQSQLPNVTGHWRLSITFDQGAVPGTFELKQDGETVTGRFTSSFTGEAVPLEGELSQGKLTLSGSTTAGPHPGEQLDFAADVKTNAVMSGTLSWRPGDFAWTAERAK